MDIDIEEEEKPNDDNNPYVNIYLKIFQDINCNYNLLRMILFDLLNVYVTVYNYYLQYTKFNLYIEREYKNLFDIAHKDIRIYTIDKKNKCPNDLNLLENTFIVIGIENFYKYKSAKFIIKEIINYEKKILNYLIYLQERIITLINGMNKFTDFYRYCLNIIFNYRFDIDNSNEILIDKFNSLKQNYFLKVVKHMHD